MYLLDFETLQVIWWCLLGLLLIGFAIFGGIDLGAATILPYVARKDMEKRIILNSIGPTWEGNQVWFILGAGAIFAAWPTIYAVAFSNFYYALFLILITLILRPVGFDFRSKIANNLWRNIWDAALFTSGLIPSLVFGIAVGNVLQGISFETDEFMFLKNNTSFWSLFSPFTLLCGLLSLSMIITQGAAFISLKTERVIQGRSIKILKVTPLIMIILFIIGGIFIKDLPGFILLENKVIQQQGAWLLNYQNLKWSLLAPSLVILTSLLSLLLALANKYKLIIITNSLSILGIISTVGLSMFPFILPSNSHFQSSLTVWNSSSSKTSLFIMLIAVLIFMPIILIYTTWAYKTMFGKVKEEDINKRKDEAY